MTEIDVHYNAADKLHHACRLLRKAAVAAGARVVVVGDAAQLDALDAALWGIAPTEFVPHCRHDAPGWMLARTPVVMWPARHEASPPHREIIVNLGVDLPDGFERFERLIDLVGEDEDERRAGRLRWRHYADRGYAITRHDVGARR